MSPEAQRIAIAEACGYKNVHRFNSFLEGRFHRDGTIVGDVDGLTKAWVPNYLADLNAMHEAETVLTDTGPDGQWAAYRIKLMSVCLMAQCDFLHATAAQRAEAFLRTLNLWKEAADV